MINNFLLYGFYLLSVGLFITLLYQTYQKSGFSFHLLFSLLYFVTFYAGFPLSLTMAIGYDYVLPELTSQWKVFAVSGAGYLVYYGCYILLPFYTRPLCQDEIGEIAKFRTKITACLLALVAISALSYFLYLNGFLIFKLEKYSQLFSKDKVELAALKRFFYFILPALLIIFFTYKNKTAWWRLLIWGSLFGVLTYLIVGGTRANLALAFAFFLLVGLYQGYLSISTIIIAASLSIIAMFFLALARYRLNVSGSEAIYTFLYLSRDTFSPWENLARVFSYSIEYQGVMPIIRDFYVYIPQALWQERPDIAWNTANYFTKIVLGNQSGLAISPTLLGSFYIMGGFGAIGIGMAIVAMIIKGLDILFVYGKAHQSALIQAYCFSQLFNLIVLVREGLDAFVSRFMFFNFVFVACWIVAILISVSKRN